MSFGLGFLTALGQSAVKERETRVEREKLEREQTEKQNSRSLAMLQRLVETDDLLPDEARNAAAQHLFRLGANPKAGEKDYTGAFQDIFAIVNRPRPLSQAPTPHSIASNAVQATGQGQQGQGQQGQGQNTSVVPQFPATSAAPVASAAPSAPSASPQMVSGLVTSDERNARQDSALRRKLGIEQEFAGPKYTTFSRDQGIMDNRGQVVREAPPAIPQLPDAPNTPFQAQWLAAKTDEDRARVANDAVKMQYTDYGNTPRSQSSGQSMGPAQMFNTPNGPILAFPNLMNPARQGIVSLPAGTSKPSSGSGSGGIDGEVSAGTKRAFDMEQGLAKQWTKETSAYKEMRRQFGLMEVGYRRFNEGDQNGGSQAVLVTFQKVLDPPSVVRESEYARSAEGLPLLARLDGYFQKHWGKGGAGVPPEDLNAMLTTAKQFLDGMKNYNSGVRARIERAALDYKLSPGNIFDDVNPPSASGGLKIGDRKRLKDGRTIIIKAISPDGRISGQVVQ